MKSLTLLTVIITVLLTGCHTSDGRSSLENTSPPPKSSPENVSTESANGVEKAVLKSNEIKRGYIGCWNGMRGGRLKITLEKIRDIGSGEESVYKELPMTSKATRKGLQTGEMYLLEAAEDFPKSFLARIIKFSFNSDGTVGIDTFESYDDYLEGKLEGMGLFGKTECE